jgi:hypothetical protein
MFALILVFAFILVVIFILIKIIDLILDNSYKIKLRNLKLVVTILAFLITFFSSTIFVALGINLIFSLFVFLGLNQDVAQSNFDFDLTDCPSLLEAIHQNENQIYKFENHRYIEEVAPLFTIKLEYEQGAKKLRTQSEKYQNLALSEKSINLTARISQKMLEKANLFDDRVKIGASSSSNKQILKLLEKMDRVTEERLKLVDRVKQQCNSSKS